MSAIRVKGLSKRYLLGELHSDLLSERIGSSLRRVFGQERSAKRQPLAEFWALSDVAFDVEHGQVIGIIGRNGAGKSTLLKILSRITEPTSGSVEIEGRVASLLEVGTGFHPELSGRDNIFLNGAILGMSRGEIRRKLDDIVSFAEIEKFLDTPVKRYSSGMYVRLAFAVAAHLESEILVVDEVLAVGDAEFQRKCLGKMSSLTRDGRTVLFVSHNMPAITSLTERCIWLNGGKIADMGPSQTVVEKYLGGSRQAGLEYLNPDSHRPTVARVELNTTPAGGLHTWGKPLSVRITVRSPRPLWGGAVAFQVFDADGQAVMHMWSSSEETPLCENGGEETIECHIPKLRLYMGKYTLRVHFTEKPGGEYFGSVDGICPFEVSMHEWHRDRSWHSGACVYLEDGTWKKV